MAFITASSSRPAASSSASLRAVGRPVVGRSAERVDLEDQVLGVGVELGGALVAHAVEAFSSCPRHPALLVLELLQLVLQLGQRLGIEGTQRGAGLVDRRGKVLGRAGCGTRGCPRAKHNSQCGEQALPRSIDAWEPLSALSRGYATQTRRLGRAILTAADAAGSLAADRFDDAGHRPVRQAVGMPCMSLSISSSYSGSVCTGTFAVICTTL